MNTKMFFDNIKKGELRQLYLLHGEEEYAKEKAIEALVNLSNPAVNTFNVDYLDDPPVANIMLACEMLPLMDERRFIIIRNSGLFSSVSSEVKELSEYLKNLPDTTCCVFISKGKCDERKAFYKSFPKESIVNFEIYSDVEAADFAVNWAKKQGITLSRNSAFKLVSMAGKRLDIVFQETEKACAYAWETKEITDEVIDASVCINLEYSVFKMLDYFVAKKPAKGFEILAETIKNEGNSAIISLLMFFVSRFRLMLSAKTFIEQGESKKRAAELLRINTYAAKKTVEQATKFSKQQLENAVLYFAQADYAIKSGQSKDRIALESAIVKVFL